MTTKKPDMREDVESWDIRIERCWPFSPLYRVDIEVVPPVRVFVGVNFTNEASAVEFEGQVRKLLEAK